MHRTSDKQDRPPAQHPLMTWENALGQRNGAGGKSSAPINRTSQVRFSPADVGPPVAELFCRILRCFFCLLLFEMDFHPRRPMHIMAVSYTEWDTWFDSSVLRKINTAVHWFGSDKLCCMYGRQTAGPVGSSGGSVPSTSCVVACAKHRLGDYDRESCIQSLGIWQIGQT